MFNVANANDTQAHCTWNFVIEGHRSIGGHDVSDSATSQARLNIFEVRLLVARLCTLYLDATRIDTLFICRLCQW